MAISGPELCTAEDVSDWWSVAGMTSRMDDDLDLTLDAGESTQLSRIIMRASSVVITKLSQRYSVAQLTGVPFISHVVAVLSAYTVSSRRNLPASPFLKEEVERCMEIVNDLAANRANLAGVAEEYDTGPFCTNLHVDNTYRSTRFRRINATSVGEPAAPPIKSYQEQYNFYPFE